MEEKQAFKQLKAVVFDCDGVMFDSGGANRAYYDSILEHLGKPPMNDEQFAVAHMATVFGTLEMLFPDPEDLAAAHAFRKTTTYFPFIKLMIPEPHLVELLEFLRPRYKTGVCTNRTNTMGNVLSEHGMEHLFDIVVTALDAERPKPFPDPLILSAKKLGVAPEQAAYIGDSSVDEEAARAANMPFIAFANPDLKADVHVDSMRQVKELFGAGSH